MDRELYKIEELKELNVGDLVTTFLHYYDDEPLTMYDVPVVLKDNDCIYFDNGTDFPINEQSPFFLSCEIETEFAIQDTGDYMFKVFKNG